MIKEPPTMQGDAGLFPGLGQSPGEVNGNPSQYSCLDNPMDRGAHEVGKSRTQLSTHTHMHWKTEIISSLQCKRQVGLSGTVEIMSASRANAEPRAGL